VTYIDGWKFPTSATSIELRESTVEKVATLQVRSYNDRVGRLRLAG